MDAKGSDQRIDKRKRRTQGVLAPKTLIVADARLALHSVRAIQEKEVAMELSERNAIRAELTPPFLIHYPEEQTSPIVFCSPHSGRIYPSVFLNATKLDADTLRRSEDCYVDELFAAAPSHGAPLLTARFPRAYLDVNREPYELDPALFDEPLPEYANPHTMRVIGGLGTIARIVSESQEIYDRPLPLAVAHERIECLYRPFHSALRQLLDQTRDRFGYAILIDCHSMPSISASGGPLHRSEFVLGDRFGTSCDDRIARQIRMALNQLDYRVQLNRPYAGGFITEHYGAPAEDIHAIQIEINRSLYMKERTLQRGARFQRFRNDISSFIETITRQAPGLYTSRLAAE